MAFRAWNWPPRSNLLFGSSLSIQIQSGPPPAFSDLGGDQLLVSQRHQPDELRVLGRNLSREQALVSAFPGLHGNAKTRNFGNLFRRSGNWKANEHSNRGDPGVHRATRAVE